MDVSKVELTSTEKKVVLVWLGMEVSENCPVCACVQTMCMCVYVFVTVYM